MKISLCATLLVSAASITITDAARAATYDAGTDALPASPFVRYDAQHPISSIPEFSPGVPNPYYNTGYTPSPDHSVSGGVYHSGLSDTRKYTFWYDPSQTLDSNQTIELRARMRITSSTSSSNDRAGVALALTDDQNRYTEMYLGTDEIFLNGVGRTRVGTFAIDADGGFHDYVLRVQGTDVTVLVDGVPRLTGSTFDANTVNAPTLENWAVFGDITGSASGGYELQSFSSVVVPEPGAGIAILLLTGAALVRTRRG